MTSRSGIRNQTEKSWAAVAVGDVTAGRGAEVGARSTAFDETGHWTERSDPAQPAAPQPSRRTPACARTARLAYSNVTAKNAITSNSARPGRASSSSSASNADEGNITSSPRS